MTNLTNQRTLRRAFNLVGTGLHSGRPVRLSVRPASAEHGIWFRRVDVTDKENMIPASWNAVNDTRLCTRLCNEHGVEISTVEHLMAALAGCGIHSALIEVDGPELPILDGSSRQFVREILKAGIQDLDAPLRVFRVTQPVKVEENGATAELLPSDCLSIDFTIDYPGTPIGRQSREMRMANGSFVHELSDCRTFCLGADVTAMKAAGLALGGTLENAIVVDPVGVRNPGGLRRGDEYVRHKMLDVLGDLALAGAPIVGTYRGHKAGHGITNKLLRRAFALPGVLVLEKVSHADAENLPGQGVSSHDLAQAS